MNRVKIYSFAIDVEISDRPFGQLSEWCIRLHANVRIKVRLTIENQFWYWF